MRSRIGFQGEPGAFSHEAVEAYFGATATPVPLPTCEACGAALAGREVDALLLPLENSLVGSVTGTLDVLVGGGVRVLGEIVRPIRHQLLGVPGTGIARLRRVISHPIALGQCQGFFRSHPQIEAVAVLDTAGAAREVRDRGDPEVAAIAPRGAAARYTLDIVAEELQDRDDNSTRFLHIGRACDGADAPGAGVGTSLKTAIVVTPRNVPGALVALLEPIARRGLNVSMLGSRPAGTGPWAYRFYIEFVGPVDRGLDHLAREVEERVGDCRVVGSWAVA